MPSRLLGDGVVAPHMGRATSLIAMDFCLVIGDTLYFSGRASYRGATGDSLSGVWDGSVANFHNTTSDVKLAVYLLDGTDWFLRSFAAASATGTIELTTGSGRYVALGSIGPRSAPIARTPQIVAQTISAGVGFTCGLSVTGGAYCWGLNNYGQLGDGTTASRSTPRPVAGGHIFKEISAGEAYACGLTPTGAAYCWGLNGNGRLGDGTTTNRTTPVLVSGGLTFIEITAGAQHTCGLTQSGLAYCWGYNYWSALGDGTAVDRLVPTKVAAGRTFAQISAGGYHTCGVALSGLTYCWGYGGWGELGDGNENSHFAPVTAVVSSGALGLRQVSAGDRHTCALTEAGTAYCWGDSRSGQLGQGVYSVLESSPMLVAGAHVFKQISAGFQHTCAVTSSAVGYCWGSNQSGDLGVDYDNRLRRDPTLVDGGIAYGQVSAGDATHTCAVGTTGLGYCWGDNGYGQLGGALGTGWSSDSPGVISPTVGGLGMSQLTGGVAHTCGLGAFGVAYCWGMNTFGQLGDATTTDRTAPVRVAGSFVFKEVSAAGYHTCGLTTAGEAYCWGFNNSGELGDGTTDSRLGPVPVVGGYTFVHIGTGWQHTCGLTSSGTVYCWGSNFRGQLGDGTTTSHVAPNPVQAGAQRFTSIAVGSDHTCALTSSGAAYCWGKDAAVGHLAPTLVATGVTFKQLSGGDGFTCGLDLAGSAYCWGSNPDGQLGDGTTDLHDTPALVSGGLSFAEIAAGGSHACAIGITSGTYCWGWNYYGQLGNNSNTARLVPTAVYGNPTFDHVMTGFEHSCAVDDGAVSCWGNNAFGQLGDNTTINRLTPRILIQMYFKW